MISPADYESSANAELQRDDTESALVHAVLALASALNKLADSHYWIAESASDLTPPKQAPGRRQRLGPPSNCRERASSVKNLLTAGSRI